MTTTFSDYRAVSGLFLPFRIERYVDGHLREVITVDTIQINPTFPVNLFRR